MKGNNMNICMKCNKESHYMIDIYNQNNFPTNLCNKHTNFKPNRLFVWLDHKYHIHYIHPKTYMRIHGISYKQAKLKYYKLKYWQQINFNT